MQTLDCRGLACPQPVIAVKQALEKLGGEELHILLDPGAPHENVARFLKNRGVTTSVYQDGACCRIDVKPASASADSKPAATIASSGKVFFITSDQLGDGPTELGRLLMKNFIISLLDQTIFPDRIFFLNTAIHLTTEGSEVLGALEQLGNNGVEILSCGLCLDFFKKKELLRAGIVTNMFTTAETLLLADSVIKL